MFASDGLNLGKLTPAGRLMEQYDQGLSVIHQLNGGAGRSKPLPACKLCGGSGINGMDPDCDCPRCGGSGDDPKPHQTPKAFLSETVAPEDMEWLS